MNRLQIRVSLLGAVFLLLFWCDGCDSVKISNGGTLYSMVGQSSAESLLKHIGLKYKRYARDTHDAELSVNESYQNGTEFQVNFVNGTADSNRTEIFLNVTDSESINESLPIHLDLIAQQEINSSVQLEHAMNSTNAEPESTPEPITSIEPETASEPLTSSVPSNEPETTSESHITTEPDPETTSEPTPEPESTLELTSEPEPTTKINSTKEPISEPTTEPKPETTNVSEPISEPKSSEEPTTEPSSITEPIYEPKSEPTNESVSTSEPIAEATSPDQPIFEPTLSTEHFPEPTSEPKTEAEPTSEPESTPEPNPTSEPESTPEPEVSSEPHPEPKSTAEPVSEPTSEPKVVSEPSPEPESSSPEPEVKPTSEPGSEPEPEGEAFAEPHPNWNFALEEWQWGWEVLVYFFAVLFLILAGLSLLSVVRLWKIKHLLSKNYFMVLNILIICKCVLRAVYLLIDPYNMHGTYHAVLSYFLYSTAFPCLTAAFSILFYALLLATKMKVLSSKIQKSSVLISIIAFHFVLSIATDFVVGFFSNAKVMLLICQSFYILWGIILFVGYIFIFRRLRESALNRRKTLKKHSVSYPSDVSRKSVISSMGSLPRPKKSKNKSTLNSAITVTLIAATCGIFCVLLELFGMFYVFRVFADGHIPEPWAWYVHQFLLRVVEVLMCAIMIYVGSQPMKYNRRNDSQLCYVFCFVLKKCCCSSQEDSAMEMDQTASFGSSRIKSYSDSEHESSDAKFPRKKSKAVILEQNGNGPQPCKHTHIVIEEGLVRFRSEDELTDRLSDRAASLPDLLHGNVGCSPGVNTGMCNMAFTSNGNVEATAPALHRTENLGSVGTIGTIGTNIPSINLAHSLQWEFDKAYDRSFQLADDTDDTPPTCGEVDTQEQGTESVDSKADSSDGTDDSCGPASPTRLPLIKDNVSSTDVNL